MARKVAPYEQTVSPDETQQYLDGTICIAVAAHKPYRMPTDSVYLPLHVGRELHPENIDAMGAGFIGDNTGANISSMNAQYSELTGLYWLWKNCDAEYKGLVHYRRHFETTNFIRKHAKDRFERIATGNDFRTLLKKAPVIVPTARNYVIESVGSHYEHTMRGASEQIAIVQEVIADKFPEYSDSLRNQLNRTHAHMFNMLVMRSDLFEDYCSWIFPLLGEVSQRVDSTQYDAFEARYPGRISEWLLDVWIETNHVPYIEMPTMSPEPVNWARKGSAFLAAKFMGRKYEGSF